MKSNLDYKEAYLNLGPNKNYKTKIIQNRWEQQRSSWLGMNTNNQIRTDPRDGIPAQNIPTDHRKMAKNKNG